MSKCYCTKCTVEGNQGEDHLGGDMSGSICSRQVLFLPQQPPPPHLLIHHCLTLKTTVISNQGIPTI